MTKNGEKRSKESRQDPLSDVIRRSNAFGSSPISVLAAIDELDDDFKRESGLAEISARIAHPIRFLIQDGLSDGRITADLTVNSLGAASIKFFEKLKKHYPELTCCLALSRVPPIYKFTIAVEQIKEWAVERDILINVAEAVQNSKRGDPREIALPSNLVLLVQPNKSVRCRGYDLLRFVFDPGADLARLRRCPICLDVYWAKRLSVKRLEASTCGDKLCRDNFNQRSRRIRNYEKRLATAAENMKKTRMFPKDHPTRKKWTDKVAKLKRKLKELKRKNGDI